MVVNNVNKYGVPSQKKFPMPDADHVRSAIKFFNYVDPQYEKVLARAILLRAKEYGVDISEMSIGDNNRFKKYLPNSELRHHGIKGQKWGIRRFQNEDGSYTEEGKKRYGFGSSKPTDTQISAFRSDLKEAYRHEDSRYKKMEQYAKKAYALAEKYDFDQDDGGGGTTEADRKAGAKYMEYWNKYEYLDQEISEDIAEKVNKEVISKYGSTRINSYRFKQNAKAGAALIGVAGLNVAIFTHPLASLAIGAGGLSIGLAYVSMKVKKAKKSPLSTAEEKRLKELEKKDIEANRHKADREDWYSSKEYKEMKELLLRRDSKYV